MTGWIDLPPAASTGRGSASWGDGYVVDAPYFEPVLTDLSPAWLSFLSVLHGQPPLDLARPLTWLDLGAASGISACMVAAANPTVDVWGFDHNPGHVERGRGLAARAGLANCHFEEASFATLAADRTIGPAEADVIVVSGVYSWVSAANQGHIREIIRQRLRPGGLAYVMYETAPGWSSMVPLAEALRLLTDADGRRPDQAFHDAAAALQALAEAGSPYFPLGAREQVQMDGWPDADGFYAAHEYLGHHFGPLLFDDVVHAMGEARCSYLGQVDATDHLAAYWAPPAVADAVHGAPDPVTRELYRD
ncbi:MAG: methyltransferase regulatory domain-containing protein, partial [Acidimicrobiales bacterium]|nr:methyltransferase regulatory domain-containing protein [Acidimicrobiales bacterium]